MAFEIKLQTLLDSVTEELDLSCKENGLDWWVYADRAVELRTVKASLETLITFVEKK